MENIIKELYLGRVDKDMGCVDSLSALELATKGAKDIENRLKEQLSGKDGELLSRYILACGDVNNEVAMSNFILGFKLGARITAQALYSDY